MKYGYDSLSSRGGFVTLQIFSCQKGSSMLILQMQWCWCYGCKSHTLNTSSDKIIFLRKTHDKCNFVSTATVSGQQTSLASPISLFTLSWCSIVLSGCVIFYCICIMLLYFCQCSATAQAKFPWGDNEENKHLKFSYQPIAENMCYRYRYVCDRPITTTKISSSCRRMESNLSILHV